MGFRFYAAAPLTTHDGFQLGTLCLIDKEPRDFTTEQGRLLGHLAAIVMDEMELRLDALRAIARKNEFLALASHELRTPLGTAKAYLELAADELTEEQGGPWQFVQKAGVAIDKITMLITDLLDVSRIEHGKLILRVTEFDFDHLVAETVDSVRPITPSHALRITGNTNRRVKGDKERIQQVLINLLTNAVKYSPGKEEVGIELSGSADDVRVSVQDHGIGIAPEHLEKIFFRFHREQNAQEHFPGLGVGLYIAGEITREHHGKLWAESVLGAGAVFHLSLPAVQIT
jgi:signal transduction histidine kinase